MKRLIITLCILMTFKVFADSDSGPEGYSFTKHSPHREYYAVQILHLWNIAHDTNSIGRFRLEKSGLFAVYRSADGERLWKTNAVLGEHSAIYLSDDPDYVVHMADDVDSCGLSGMHGGTITNASPAKLKEVLNQTVLRFFKREQVLSTYSLSALDARLNSLTISVSHLQFYERISSEREEQWTSSIEDVISRTNPIFNKTNHTFSFLGKDGRQRIFDYTTGKLLRIEAQEEADARAKPFRGQFNREAVNAPTRNFKDSDDVFR